MRTTLVVLLVLASILLALTFDHLTGSSLARAHVQNSSAHQGVPARVALSEISMSKTHSPRDGAGQAMPLIPETAGEAPTNAPLFEPNLTPYQPSGWSDKLVISNEIGTTVDSSDLRTSDLLFIDWAAINNGTFATGAPFQIILSVDGVTRGSWTMNPPLNGNQFIFAANYMNSYQLASYYEYSNTERFYSTVHIEYHLNGFLTNKIPGFRTLNWYLVTGANAFYVNQQKNYLEAFVGIENIFKLIRVDFIQSWSAGHHPNYGIRIGLRGAFAN